MSEDFITADAALTAGKGQRVYAIQFSNDVLKVGRSGDVSKRMAGHARSAAAFGVSVTDQWCSRIVDDSRVVEKLLIEKVASRAGGSAHHGQEYFVGVSADDARVIASGLLDEILVEAVVLEADIPVVDFSRRIREYTRAQGASISHLARTVDMHPNTLTYQLSHPGAMTFNTALRLNAATGVAL